MTEDNNSDRTQNFSNGPNHPQSRSPRHQDDSLFISFRRFADGQISSMLQSVMGLPSVVSTPQSDRWTVFGDNPSYNLVRHRGTADSQSDSNVLSEDSKDQTPAKWPQGSGSSDPRYWHSQRRDNDSLRDFFGLGSFFDRFWLDEHIPLTSRIFPPTTHSPFFGVFDSDEEMPLWPAIYIMTSPYSPLQLEREARYRAYRDRDQGVFASLLSSLRPSTGSDGSYYRDPAEPEWRDAFEDLLRLKYGKPMLDREPKPVEQRQTEKEWFSGLVQRGSLGEGWKYSPTKSALLYSSQQRRSNDGEHSDSKDCVGSKEMMINGIGIHPMGIEQADAEASDSTSDPATELDMYERFIHDIEVLEHEFSKQFHDSPILRFLSDERQRHIGEITAYRSLLAEKEKESQSTDENSDSWLDLVSGGNKRTVPDSVQDPSASESSPTADGQAVAEQSRQTYVVSTSTTTERVRLPDGSIHKKTVKTQRFSDGREESNEFAETTNLPRENPPDTALRLPAQDSSDGKGSSSGGWFWSR